MKSVPLFRERLGDMTATRPARLFQSAAAGLSLLVAGCSIGTDAIAGPGADVQALTGAHTRVVWVQGDGTDPRAAGDQLVLMGFDTHDGKGERVILGNRGSYVRPLLTPRGNRIVFSSRTLPGPPEVFIVNWDGTALRRITGGHALALWENPADGTEWVYVGSDNKKYDFSTVTRFPIDEPHRRELVWNKSLVSTESFQVSTDGRYAGGQFPWPKAGIAELPNGGVKQLGEGCWTALSNARGPLFWYFDGAHRNLTMVDVDTDARWMVNINHAPGFDGAEVFHPRWTNHSRFLVISGPYNQGGANQARTGGKQVEVYLGRFSADFSRVEAWARVTNNSGGDSYPDVWIDAGRSPYPQRPRGPIGPPNVVARSAPGAPAATPPAGRLAINVVLTRPGPIPTPQAILPYRNALVVNEYKILDVIAGTYAEQTIPIAQWAIRNSRVLAEARKIAGAAFTLTVERYDTHTELEGERLIADSNASKLPLYYDVGQP
jgi:hypothetical protein